MSLDIRIMTYHHDHLIIRFLNESPMRPVFALLGFCCLVTSFLTADDNAGSTNLLKPVGKQESWRFEQHEAGKGMMKVDEESVTFTSTELDGTDWHVQAFQVGLDLKEGASYTLSFEAKSPERRAVIVIAGIDQDDYHEIGLHEEIFATSVDYKKYEYTFQASGVAAGKNRVGFVLGTEMGSMTVKNLKLVKK